MEVSYEYKSSPVNYIADVGLSKTAHMHSQVEVIYVRKGRSAAYADRNGYMLNPGDIFIAFPNQIHYYETAELGEYMVIIFTPKLIYEYGSVISKSIPESNFISAKDSESFSWIFDKIYSSEGDYRFLEINGYINVLMGSILPMLKLKTVSAANNSTIHSVVDFCSHNFKEDISLDDVAESLHLSKYYISRLINKNLNQNFNEYINNLRISEACNILKETEMKIADISEDVGFGTIRSFNRSFKQVMGISPLEYRSSIAALKSKDKTR